MNKKNKSTLKTRVVIVLAILLGFLGGVRCGSSLTERIKKEKEDREEFIQPSDTLSDWMTLQMAIAMTESRFNPKAVGKDGDWGVFQITDIYVKECNRILKQEKYAHEDAFDVEKSLEMFEVLQSHYNPQRDLERAIRYHNKAGWYKKRVLENIAFIQQMEEARKLMKQRG